MRRLAGVIAACLLVPAALAPGARAASGPALDVTPAEVDTALKCTPDLGTADHDPVLLTPAFSTAEASYGWNYLARLPNIGIPTCSITVPDSGYGDLQRTAEFVVAAVRRMHAESGRKVVLLGHQHGALDEFWALTFWPDIARKTSDLISLATPYNGSTSPQALCGNGAPCAAATRQISAGSLFTGALADAPLPKGPAITSIASLDDQLITPEPAASHLDGATNIVLQDVCPGRQVSHFDILADNVAYELVLDAIEHDGPADPARIPVNACDQKLMPDSNALLATAANGFLPIFLAQNTAAAVPSEPESRAYTQRQAPELTITRKLRVRDDGRATLRVGCRSVGRTNCSVKLRLRDASGFVERRGFVVRPSSPRALHLRLERDAPPRLRVTLQARDALRNSARLSARIHLIRPQN